MTFMLNLNSKSLFFTRNSQLVKKSQSSQNNNQKNQSQTGQQSASQNQSIQTTQQPQPAPSSQQPAQSNYDLDRENQIRTQLGLAPYKSHQQMINEMSKMNYEYESAKRMFVPAKMSEADFKRTFPTVHHLENDIKKGSHFMPHQQYSYQVILPLIIENNTEELNKIPREKVLDALKTFMSTLPRIQHRESMEAYEFRLSSELMKYQFKYGKLREYIMKAKLKQAKEDMDRRSGVGPSSQYGSSSQASLQERGIVPTPRLVRR